MKKHFLFACTAIVALLMTACSEEDNFRGQDGNVVTFSVGVPQLATRAIGEGESANKLYWGVYDHDNKLLPEISNTAEGQDFSQSGTVHLTLAQDKKYSIVFWAANETNSMCSVDWNARKMSVEPKFANQESYDAFCAYVEIDNVSGYAKRDVTLYRPFAQLNIGTADVEKAKKSGLTVKNTKVRISGLPKTYDFVTGNTDECEGTFTYDCPKEAVSFERETFPVDGYEYLAMNYALLSADKQLVEVTFSYIDDDNQQHNRTYTSVPMQRNWRTNIYGNILTSEADFKVTIEPEFNKESHNVEIVEVATAESLQETINEMVDGDSITIVLTDNINLNALFSSSNAPAKTRGGEAKSNSVTLAKGRTLELDLNGFTISGTDETEANYGLIQNNGTLTISDSKGKGKLSVEATNNNGWDRYSAVISNNPGATLVINGGTIEHLGGTNMAYGIDNLTNGTLGDVNCTINGGAIKSTYRAVRQFLNSDSDENNLVINGGVLTGENKSIFFHDPSAKANNGKLIVGKNAKLNGDVYLFVTAGSTAWPVEVSIAKAALQGESTVLSANVPYDYSVVEGDDAWTVESYFTFGAFVDTVVAAKGNFNGKGIEVRIKPASGQTDNTNSCLVPNRLQKYSNPEVYYAQYQRFAELTNISITNVNFVFIPEEITVKDAWNPNGATTTKENINGELQFMNQGNVTLANCTFDKVAVSPINASAVTVCNSTFNGLQAYAIKDIKASEVNVIGNTFTDCNGAFWLADAPAKLVVTGNTFTGVGRRGAMQFSANGDYTKTEMTVKDNTVEGAFLWQLNKTVSYAQLNAILNKESNNTYTQDYTDNSIKHIAKVGEVGYFTLQEAVNAVEDGGTITLVANETFTENNRYNNGGWWDGLGYSGDKSFTIDLGGFIISQNGALNDYLMWFKNVGSKANTITIKNGTLDAGTTAYCALCTASSHDNQLTINTEDLTLINNKSDGSTIKNRAGAILNVKSGTKIIGKNSYLGIECWKATVNIYDEAEIYMNGTSSYNGCLAGVGGNGTINVYGGYGKGVKGGFIAMTSGGTINISGGEWIANTDGTIGNNSNVYVLTAQNNKYENGYAGASIINVTGGTFRGGMDAWILNDVNVEKAELNISGGNFNANPNQYVVDGKASVQNADGTWGIIDAATPKTEEELKAALENYELIILGDNITLTETAVIKGKNITIDLNGKTVTAELTSAFTATEGANLTLKNGKVVAYESTVRAIGGKVIVESGEYTSTGTALDKPATNRYSLDCREGGELVINGGTFKSNNGMINVGSTVTINGGKFENIVEKSMTRHFAYVSAPLTINDGEFYGKANSGAGGCFFCGAAAGGDIQVNGGKFTSLWTSGSVNRIFEVYFGGKINVTGGMFNTNGGIATFVTENTDEATKAAYPYVAK